MSTGEIIKWVDLSKVKNFSDLKLQLTRANPTRGEWVLGFGWDQSQWSEDIPLHHKTLEMILPHRPLALSRIDGHAMWVNKKALELAGLWGAMAPPSPKGGRIEVDERGHSTGLLIDTAKDLIDPHIPSLSNADVKSFLHQGMQLFFENGFTHIRDVGGSHCHWQVAREMEERGELKLFCEMYFNLENAHELDERLAEIKKCRPQKSRQLRLGGLKLFYDGALGSEGALLSVPYASGKQGLQVHDPKTIEEIFSRCWNEKIPVAIHTLGDEAVHHIVEAAHRLKAKGIEGELNLEHCEVVRPETITLMRSLKVRCHLQPSHFLGDRLWLKEKLGPLYRSCFPWRNLVEAGIPIHFGSDSPIEKPSLWQTRRALELSAQEGIPILPISPWSFHSHPDGSWGRNCVTKWNFDGKVEVLFRRD